MLLFKQSFPTQNINQTRRRGEVMNKNSGSKKALVGVVFSILLVMLIVFVWLHIEETRYLNLVSNLVAKETPQIEARQKPPEGFEVEHYQALLKKQFKALETASPRVSQMGIRWVQKDFEPFLATALTALEPPAQVRVNGRLQTPPRVELVDESLGALQIAQVDRQTNSLMFDPAFGLSQLEDLGYEHFRSVMVHEFMHLLIQERFAGRPELFYLMEGITEYLTQEILQTQGWQLTTDSRPSYEEEVQAVERLWPELHQELLGWYITDQSSLMVLLRHRFGLNSTRGFMEVWRSHDSYQQATLAKYDRLDDELQALETFDGSAQEEIRQIKRVLELIAEQKRKLENSDEESGPLLLNLTSWMKEVDI